MFTGMVENKLFMLGIADSRSMGLGQSCLPKVSNGFKPLKFNSVTLISIHNYLYPHNVFKCCLIIVKRRPSPLLLKGMLSFPADIHSLILVHSLFFSGSFTMNNVIVLFQNDFTLKLVYTLSQIVITHYT